MALARKKSMSVIYNGTEAWTELEPYLERFSYTDAVDESDTVSFSLADRDLKWVSFWSPEKGDILAPSIILENWNYEGEWQELACGEFIVDDFSFSAPPLMAGINGVSSPVDTGFKETQNTKTWEAVTARLVAAELAAKYGLSLVYEADEIPIVRMEQSSQADSEFLRTLCQKYGLGIKVYSSRLVIWDFKQYFSQEPVTELTPADVSDWSYRSTMQGCYTGAKVSYTDPASKKTIEVLVGTRERLYKTTQKADNEADARLIGEAAVRNANRKETVMQLTMPPQLSITATRTVRLSGFGKPDGTYFVEKASHVISKKSYGMQVELSRIPEGEERRDTGAKGKNNAVPSGAAYTVRKGDTLWDLAETFYGEPSKCATLYGANKEAIEADAVRHGKGDSCGGYWIWPGLVLTIP